MRKDWKSGQLKDFFSIATGSTPSKRNDAMYGDFLPLVKPPELIGQEIYSAKDNLSRAGTEAARMLPKDSILVSCIGNLGKIGISKVPLATNQQINAIKPNERVAVSKFMFYWTMSALFRDQLTKLASGTTVPIVNKTKFSSIYISLPPLPEQKRIVAILDDAFAGIDTAITNTEKNLTNAEELFDSELNTIFSNPHEKWIPKRLEEICRLKNGRAYKKSELLDQGKYPVLRVGNFFTNKKWYYSDLELDESKYCNTGDLLYAWSASFGPRIWEGGKVIFHYHIWRVDFDQNLVDKSFFYYWLHWDAIRIQRDMGAGTTMVHVSMKSMKTRKVHLPSIIEQKKIAERLDAVRIEVDSLVGIYQQKLTALANLRQSLLQKAFSGELTRSGAESEVREAIA